ncbi:MAG: DDE-type integrase/transposase/recombinase [Pseudoruegeria sp.]
MVDFRLTARRDAKAAKAFLKKAIERVRLHRSVSICTNKAPTYRKVIRDINHQYDPHFDYITHIDKKYRNNRVESDHAALKRLLGYRQSFQSLSCAKTTLQGMETIRTIKNGPIQNRQPGVRGEVTFVAQLFGLAA